jgi:hypothetical protein
MSMSVGGGSPEPQNFDMSVERTGESIKVDSDSMKSGVLEFINNNSEYFGDDFNERFESEINEIFDRVKNESMDLTQLKEFVDLIDEGKMDAAGETKFSEVGGALKWHLEELEGQKGAPSDGPEQEEIEGTGQPSAFEPRKSDSESLELSDEQRQQLGIASSQVEDTAVPTTASGEGDVDVDVAMTSSAGAGEGEPSEKQKKAIGAARSAFQHSVYSTLPREVRALVTDRLKGIPGKGGNSTADVIREFNEHIKTCVMEGEDKSETVKYIKGKLQEYVSKPRNAGSKGAVASGIEILQKMYKNTEWFPDVPLSRQNIEGHKERFVSDFSHSAGLGRRMFAGLGMGKSDTRVVKDAVQRAFSSAERKNSSQEELVRDVKAAIDNLDVKQSTKNRAYQSLFNVVYPYQVGDCSLGAMTNFLENMATRGGFVADRVLDLEIALSSSLLEQKVQGIIADVKNKFDVVASEGGRPVDFAQAYQKIVEGWQAEPTEEGYAVNQVQVRALQEVYLSFKGTKISFEVAQNLLVNTTKHGFEAASEIAETQRMFEMKFIKAAPDNLRESITGRVNHSVGASGGYSSLDVIQLVNSEIENSIVNNSPTTIAYASVVGSLFEYLNSTDEDGEFVNANSSGAVQSGINVLANLTIYSSHGVEKYDQPLTTEELGEMNQQFADEISKVKLTGSRTEDVNALINDVFTEIKATHPFHSKNMILEKCQEKLGSVLDDQDFNIVFQALGTVIRGNPGYGGGVKFTPTGTQEFVNHSNSTVSVMSKEGLFAQSFIMRGKILEWLSSMGIAPDNDLDGGSVGAGMKLPKAGKIDPAETLSIGTFQMTGAEVLRMINETEVTYVEGGPINSSNVQMEVGQGGTEEFSNSQHVMVSGPVMIPSNNVNQLKKRTVTQENIDNPGHTRMVQAYSTPGINYGYSDSDQTTFADEDLRVNNAGKKRMKEITGHIFEKMKQDNVTHPVLSAIGCGAFSSPADGGENTPKAWAEAMYNNLADNQYGFEKVTIAIPIFGGDDTNYQAFIDAFGEMMKEKPLQCEVEIVNASMLSLADSISDENPDAKVGILNPSDAQAVREGAMGMYWNGGHIALEELLGVFTTMLPQQQALLHGDAFEKARGISLPS